MNKRLKPSYIREKQEKKLVFSCSSEKQMGKLHMRNNTWQKNLKCYCCANLSNLGQLSAANAISLEEDKKKKEEGNPLHVLLNPFVQFLEGAENCIKNWNIDKIATLHKHHAQPNKVCSQSCAARSQTWETISHRCLYNILVETHSFPEAGTTAFCANFCGFCQNVQANNGSTRWYILLTQPVNRHGTKMRDVHWSGHLDAQLIFAQYSWACS